MKNEYYVYEWIRLDTNEPFYVGKGRDNRCYKLTRGNNHHFNNIVNSIPCVVNILHDNLSEQVAFDLEVWYIREYRDIIGYDLCNINDGGEGQSLCGKLNPMYGKPCSDKRKENISKSKKGKGFGEDNHFYGKHHTEKSKEKISKANKGKLVGEKNHNYGKHLSNETKEKLSKSQSGKKHSQATPIICLTTKRMFLYIKEASEYYGCDNSGITKCCKGKKKSCGKLPNGTKLVWKYIKWNHNKTFRINK